MEEETDLAGKVLNYSFPFDFKVQNRGNVRGRERLLFLASRDKILGFDSSPDMT